MCNNTLPGNALGYLFSLNILVAFHVKCVIKTMVIIIIIRIIISHVILIHLWEQSPLFLMVMTTDT